MPLAKISSVAARISSLVTVLLITRRRRSDPVSGRDRDRLLAALAQPPHDAVGEVVEPQRRRADRVAELEQAVEDPIDLGMVAERDRHEAGAVRVLPRRGRQLEDPIGRERANRQVVVAGPAEPAQVRAAADDLDEEARAELRVGREDRRGRRIEAIGALHRRLLHDRRRAAASAAARTPQSSRRRCSGRRRATARRSLGTTPAGAY